MDGHVGFIYSKKDIEDAAQEIYTDTYMTLYDSDTDKGEELLVSILAQKLSIKTVERIILANPHSNPLNTDSWSTMRFWQDVKKRLENILNKP